MQFSLQYSIRSNCLSFCHFQAPSISFSVCFFFPQLPRLKILPALTFFSLRTTLVCLWMPKTLIEDNYNSWTQFHENGADAKCKFGYLNGSIRKPLEDVDPTLVSSWQYDNDIVSSWLLSSISKEIIASVVYADHATA